MSNRWTHVAGAILVALSALLLGGCSGGGTEVGNPVSAANPDTLTPGAGQDAETSAVAQELKSDAPRAAPEAGAETAASADEQAFAWSFFSQLPASENIAFSPYSITAAVAMVSAGAAGETLSQIRNALHFAPEGEAFHASQNALSLALASRNRAATDPTGAPVLRSSNDLWMLPALRPHAPFLDTLATYYGSGVHLAAFDLAPEEARLAINQKVASDTNGLIDPLLEQGDVGNRTKFVLTNALYFKASWQNPFEPLLTHNQPFHALDGSTVEVPMMQREEPFRYATGSGFQAVALPYAQGKIEMLLIVPDAGRFEVVRASISAQVVADLVAVGEPRGVLLGLPRFSVTFRVPLRNALARAGMIDAFDPSLADFSGIAGGTYIDDVVHVAKVIVDEEGTEAAAATATTLTPDIGVGPTVVLTIDRPFVFVIRDVPTRAVLFVGQVVRP